MPMTRYIRVNVRIISFCFSGAEWCVFLDGPDLGVRIRAIRGREAFFKAGEFVVEVGLGTYLGLWGLGVWRDGWMMKRWIGSGI